MKVSRRIALKSAGLMTLGGALGCESPSAPGPADAYIPRSDAGMPGVFRHGVASGDPLPTSVILWTRVSLDAPPASVTVDWQLSSSPTFGTIAASGSFETNAGRDWTVKIDATGLSPATTYYYRFISSGDVSPTGRTRTAPADAASVSRLRFAVCSCASYPHGYYHGYRHIAERADLDAVIHLGDYIYEYGNGQYPVTGAVREVDPPGETFTLEDYRRRYAHYRRDPDLQEAHRQHPFIVVWDDHESADNSYRDGANHHDPAVNGPWAPRLAAAQQVFDEWMPIRTAASGVTTIWRSFRYGSLAELIMLDTRIEGRTLQAERGQTPDPNGTLLSATQEAFLIERLTTSPAQWKVIGQQVMFAPLLGFPNSDQWDGYPAQRQRIVDAIRGQVNDVVVLTGDIHSSWAQDVILNPRATPAEAPVAVEFVAPGISSPGLPGGDIFLNTIRPLQPHARYINLSDRGYYVLDLTPQRAQAAYTIVNDVTSLTDKSTRPSEAWSAMAGANRLNMTADTPAEPPGNPPPLAP